MITPDKISKLEKIGLFSYKKFCILYTKQCVLGMFMMLVVVLVLSVSMLQRRMYVSVWLALRIDVFRTLTYTSLCLMYVDIGD